MSEISLQLLQHIQRIHIQTKQLAQDLLAGAYRSAFKGKGMEFEEVRVYENGDEIRDIDWKVSARMNQPFVKTFREEREITVMLVVDVSASSRFGTGDKRKSDLIAEIGGVIAFSAIKNNDKVGLLLFSDRVEKYLIPKSGVRHVLRVIRELLAFKPKGKGTDIGKALAYLGNIHRKSSVCFLISDFICSDYSHELTLIARKHDVIGISVNDPAEVSFPDVHLVEVSDLENGQSVLVNSSSRKIQEFFENGAKERLKSCKHIVNGAGAGFIDIRTDKPYIPEIKKFFKLRGKNR